MYFRRFMRLYSCCQCPTAHFRLFTSPGPTRMRVLGDCLLPCIVCAMLSRITSDPLQRCDKIPIPRTHAQPAQHLSVGVLKRAWCGGARHVRHMVKARDAHNGQGTEPKRSRCAMACRMAVGCPGLRDESAGRLAEYMEQRGVASLSLEGTDSFVPSPRCQSLSSISAISGAISRYSTSLNLVHTCMTRLW